MSQKLGKRTATQHPNSSIIAYKEVQTWLNILHERVQQLQKNRHDTSKLDSELLGQALQDIQRQLSDPKDLSGICKLLPEMARRAVKHPYAHDFRRYTEPTDTRIPPEGIRAIAIPLVDTANQQLAGAGLSGNTRLANIAHMHKPDFAIRFITFIAMMRTRRYLFETVLGEL